MTAGKRYLGGYVEHLRRLEARLDAIEAALSVARNEPEPEHRGRMLDALDRAAESVRAEHREAETVEEKRSSLRLIRGTVDHSREQSDWPPSVAASPAGHWPDRIRDPAARSAG